METELTASRGGKASTWGNHAVILLKVFDEKMHILKHFFCLNIMGYFDN